LHYPPTVANCWPTREQELLLHACLLQGDAALTAWRAWQQLFEADKIDAATRRLLPLLYRNLRAHGLRGPVINRLREEYNRTWSQNQFSFHHMAELLRAFDGAGIQTILLKGSALATLFYADAGLRPMMDIDLLVRQRDALPAIRLLQRLGWKSKYEPPEALLPFEHAVEFTNANFQNLDLHWRALWEGAQAAGDDDFWAASISAEIGGGAARTLNPSDHLLHVCVHGAKWNETAPLRWVADALLIIRSQRYRVDWARLVRQARRRHLTLPLQDTLGYLRQSMAAPIPIEVLRELQSAPTSRLERQFYRIRLGPNDALRTLPVLWHWLGSLRSECAGNPFRRLAQFLQYLQCLWGLSRKRDVPTHFTGRLIRRLCQLVPRRSSSATGRMS
jgi:hypothetical protein